MTCDWCLGQLTACISAEEGMVVRAWWCQSCGWHGPAKCRERLLTVDHLEVDRGVH
jgi:hypothetical protein